MAFSSSANGSIINFDDNSNNVVYRSVQLNETKQPSTLGSGNGSSDFTSPLYDNDSSSTFRAIGGGFTLTNDNMAGLAPLPSLSSAKQLTLSSVHTNASSTQTFDSLMDAWPYTAPMSAPKELSFVALSASASPLDRDDCPPVPVYVEQYTTFTVARKSVFDDIAAHLTSTGVDHSVHDHKVCFVT
jgi:hypothetical protein